METIVMNISIDRNVLRGLLCTAIEGGSNYWATFSNAERNAEGDYVRVKVTEIDRSGQRRVNRYITAEALAHGLERLAQAGTQPDPARHHFDPGVAMKHFGEAISETGDASTADVVLQMTIFGELVYG